MTRDLSTSLAQLIRDELPLLEAVSDLNAGRRSGADSNWSPKEELGHLIDSAANNHVRFVHALTEPEFRGASYAQNEWVTAHRYQEMPWLAIVDFWHRYNNFIASLLARIPENKLQTLCFIDSDNGVSLDFLVSDYVLHMRHHLDHILSRENVTAYPAVAPDR